MKQQLICVAGATGTVGREVVRALTERGARVRALVRTPRPGLLPAGVEQVAGNLGDPVAVGRALADATGAFYVS
ncbi:MAG: NmrA family NAD(P)-binding protein, partial [Kofleriaceae bacterium]|nr:NmrA family NAD(P)-binding protein [Kofleriaceae bacterium]